MTTLWTVISITSSQVDPVSVSGSLSPPLQKIESLTNDIYIGLFSLWLLLWVIQSFIFQVWPILSYIFLCILIIDYLYQYYAQCFVFNMFPCLVVVAYWKVNSLFYSYWFCIGFSEAQSRQFPIISVCYGKVWLKWDLLLMFILYHDFCKNAPGLLRLPSACVSLTNAFSFLLWLYITAFSLHFR